MLISISLNYKDLYSKAFGVFYKQYKSKKASNIFVQFTNYASDKLERNAYKDPDHSDMVGVYGYPLKYVINYPGDIWYGQRCRFLRVLKANDLGTEKCLYVQELKEVHEALRFARYVTDDYYSQFELAKQYVKQSYYIANNINAKAAFLCLQGIFSKDGKTVKMEVRTPLEQSTILLKCGYTTVVDSARNEKTAVVNSREPEQICFLTRHAFTVVETFTLNDPKQGAITIQTSDEELEHKFAALLFNSMGDKLAEFDTSKNLYWSKKGILAKISLLYKPNSHDNLRLGEKKHKATKLGNLKYMELSITGEHGTFKTSFEDDTFEKAIVYIVAQYKTQPLDTNWQPDNKKKYEQRVIDEKNAKRKAFKEALQNSAIENSQKVEYTFNAIAKHYKSKNINFDADRQRTFDIMNIMVNVIQIYTSKFVVKGEYEEQVPHFAGIAKRLLNLDDDLEQIAKTIYNLLKKLGKDFYKEQWFRLTFRGGMYAERSYDLLYSFLQEAKTAIGK